MIFKRPDWMPNLVIVLGYAYLTLALLFSAAIALVLMGNEAAATVMEAAENLGLVVFGGTMTISKDLVGLKSRSEDG